MQHHHHQQQQHTIDARLPPDLLPYGQHQSLALQSSLKNSSSSSTGSSTSTAILDHRINQTSYNNGNGNNNRFAYTFTDDLSESYHDDDEDDDVDDDNVVDATEQNIQQMFLRQTPIEEPDLRIYHNDSLIPTKTIATTSTLTKSYGKLNSQSVSTQPSPTMSSAMMNTTNKLTSAIPTHRTIATKNIYELTPASAILNATKNNGKQHLNRPFNSNTLKAQPTMASKTMDGNNHSVSAGSGGGVNCKPRQSVVRTSPSFSFLSTGYNQQQDNFL